jgi:cell division protease FtsH
MFWLFIIMLGVLLWTLVSKSGQSTREKEPSYSEFMADVDRGNVKEVELYLSPTSYEVQGEKREPAEKFRVTIFKESAPDLVKTLRDKNVLINVKEVNRADWVSVLFSAAPILLLVAFWIFMMRQMQAGGNKGGLARRSSRHWENLARARYCGRGQRSILFDFRFRLRRNVRGRWRQPCPRSVRTGQKECALHYFHRRN